MVTRDDMSTLSHTVAMATFPVPRATPPRRRVKEGGDHVTQTRAARPRGRLGSGGARRGVSREGARGSVGSATSAARSGRAYSLAESIDSATGMGGGGVKGLRLTTRLRLLWSTGLELMTRNEVHAGVHELERALRLRLAHATQLPKTEPLWQYAEELVLRVNHAAVERMAAAEAPEHVRPLLRTALRFVADAELEESSAALQQQQQQKSTPPRRQSRASTMSLGSTHRRRVDYFAGFAALKSVLRACVLNNIAVHERTSDPACLVAVLASLMKAFVASEGLFCTLILYNLAVTFVACGRFDDAVEAIARGFELAAAYLRLAPPSERAVRRVTTESMPERGSTTRSRRGTMRTKDDGAEGQKAPNEDEKGGRNGSGDGASAAVVDEARREWCRSWMAYRTLIHTVATHVVLLHHLVATIATWCDMFEVACYHCELALGCAQKYLGHEPHWQARCRARLETALSQAQLATDAAHGPTVAMVDRSTPPQLPLLAQGELLWRATETQEQATMAAKAPDTVSRASQAQRRSDTDNATTAVGDQSCYGELGELVVGGVCAVPVSALLLWCTRVKLPRELQAYLSATSRYMQRSEANVCRALTLPPLRNERGWSISSAVSSQRPRRSVIAESLLLSALQQTSPPSVASSRRGSASPMAARASVVRPGSRSPRIVTKIPPPAYQRYVTLNETVLKCLSCTTGAKSDEDEAKEIATRAPGGLGATPSTGDRQALGIGLLRPARRITCRVLDALPCASAPLTVADMAQYTQLRGSDMAAEDLSPRGFMRCMDRSLRHLSKLVMDPMPRLRARAATLMQCAWRCHRARVARQTRAAKVQDWCHKLIVAVVIVRAYRNYVACKPAVALRHALYAERLRQQRFTLIQRYLYERASVEEWGRRCCEYYRRALEARLRQAMERAAAVMLQSCWRRHAAQVALRRRMTAALHVQCAWRAHCARQELLRRRVHQRLAHAAFLQAHRSQIVQLQRWWRACRARRAVAGELPARQKAVEAYLRMQEDTFATALGPWAVVDDLVRPMHTILAVLHGAQTRRALHARYVQLCIVRRAVMRWWLRVRGAEKLARLRLAAGVRAAEQRRREEVAVACVRLQSWARVMLARNVRDRRQRELRRTLEAACCIQRAYRAYHLRQVAARLYHETHLCRELRHCRQRRERAACTLQTAWRVYHARAAQNKYDQFMHCRRHVLATRIQRLCRSWLARRQLRCARVENTLRQQKAQQAQRVPCAAVQIQSVVRMWLVQRALARRLGHELPFLRRTRAARRVQRAWRAFAARRLAQRRRLARAYWVKEYSAHEAVHSYAAMIQALVRGWLQRKGHCDGVNAKMPMVRQELADKAEGGEEQLVMSPALPGEGKHVASRGSSPCVVAQAMRQADVELPIATPSPPTAAAIRAATAIQRLWRGYQVRRCVTVYEEVYYETVTITTMRHVVS